MVRKCAICGIPQRVRDEQRSYHEFPKEQKRLEEWKKVIGISDLKKSAMVCSDHFNTEDFSSSMMNAGEIVLRRIKKTAVPSQGLSSRSRHDLISNPTCDVSGSENSPDVHQKEDETDSKVNILVENINDIDCTPSYSNEVFSYIQAIKKERVSPVREINAFENNSDAHQREDVTDSSVENNNNTDCTPLHSEDVSSCTQTTDKESFVSTSSVQSKDSLPPIIHVKTKSGFVSFRENDFSTTHKWNDFRNFVKYSRNLIKTTQRKQNRYKNKIKNLKTLMKILPKKNYLNASVKDCLNVRLGRKK